MAVATAVIFPWKDTYSVGISVVDAQHENMVNMVDELHQAMMARTGHEPLGRILSGLIEYTLGHFKTEENLMESHHYPDYLNHKAEHDRLAKAVLDFQGKFQRNEVGLTLEVMDFLEDWLTEHIQDTDKRFVPFLNAQGVR